MVDKTAAIAKELSGSDGTAAKTAAQTAATTTTRPATRHSPAYNAAVPAITECANFTQNTGLSAADYDQMITWWRYKRASVAVSGETPAQAAARAAARTTYIQNLHLANLNINASTNNETLNAWQTKAIMSDANVQQALLGVFNNSANFDALSNEVLWRESTYMPLLWPSSNERQIAASFGYFHNAGRRTSSPSGAYVTSFLAHWDTLAAAEQPASIACFTLDPKRTP